MTEAVEKVAAPASTALAPRTIPSVAALLGFDAAALQTLDVEKIERLCALQERVMDRGARDDFLAAMDAFQAKVPAITKASKAVDWTKPGGKFLYAYASFEDIVKIVRPILAEQGLSFGFDSSVDEKSLVTVVCRVSHRNGHSETARFTCPLNPGTQIMNAPQRSAATVTYAKRQALIQALALATCEEDTDARETSDDERISESQARDLDAWMEDTKTDRARFFRVFRIDRIEDLRVADYRTACSLLEEKTRPTQPPGGRR